MAPTKDTNDEWYRVGQSSWRQPYTKCREDNDGLRSFVPLQHGDVLVMSGSFQRFLQHKTAHIMEGDASEWQHLRVKYTGTSSGLDALRKRMKQERIGIDSCCITWRWIVNHRTEHPRCPMVAPRGAAVDPPPCGETRPGAGTSAPTLDGQPPPPPEAYSSSSVPYTCLGAWDAVLLRERGPTMHHEPAEPECPPLQLGARSMQPIPEAEDASATRLRGLGGSPGHLPGAK